MTPWEIKAKEFGNCNCSYGCPCQFNAPPTLGHCQAVAAFDISKGRFGDVILDGLNAVCIYQWPGAVHEGRGKMQLIIDERANAAQRDALSKIMTGEDTEPGKTMWAVFASTVETFYDTVFRPIEIDVDIEGRTGRVRVPGLVEMTGRPILNPVTGAEHRARIDIPDGFEYTIAEIGSGRSRTEGPIALVLEDSYGQFAHLHLNQSGIVH